LRLKHIVPFAALVAVVLALGGQTAAAAPSPQAHAAQGNPYTAKGICGSGYVVLARKYLRDEGIRLGRIVLLWNQAEGKNCVVAIKSHQPGTPHFIEAFLQVKGGPMQIDDGSYRYYAGPVKARARGRCIKWGGNITVAEGVGDGLISPWSHCR